MKIWLPGNMSLRRAVVILLIAASWLGLDNPPAAATVYHVDARLGNDNNNGSLEHPWRTIAKVNGAQLQPGDEVLFKRGEKWHETLTVPGSGTLGSPLVFAAYGNEGEGEPPEIDCTTALSGQWRARGDNIYSHPWPAKPGVLFYRGLPQPPIMTITLDPASDAVPAANAILLQEGEPYTNLHLLAADSGRKIISGISVFEAKWDTRRKIRVRQLNPATNQEEEWPLLLPPPRDLTPQKMSLRQPGQWFHYQGQLYLYSAVAPDQAAVRASSLDYAITTNGHDHLLLRDLALTGAGVAGLLLVNTERSTVRNLQVFGTGVLSHRTGILLMNASGNTVQENKVESALVTGIGIYASDGLAHNNTIVRNAVRNSGGAGILLGGEEPFRVAGNLIRENQIERANQLAYDSAGIYSYFCGTGNALIGNVIRNGGTPQLRSAGIMADTDSGPLTIKGNLVENNSHGGIVVTGRGHKILGNRLSHNSGPHWPTAEIVFFPVTTDVSNCAVAGNYLETGPAMNLFLLAKGSEQGHAFDYNLYHGGSALPFSWGEQPMSFTTWQQRTGQDGHSQYSARPAQRRATPPGERPSR